MKKHELFGEEIERFKEYLEDEPEICREQRERGDFDEYRDLAEVVMQQWAECNGYELGTPVEVYGDGMFCADACPKHRVVDGLHADVSAIVLQAHEGDDIVNFTLGVRYWVPTAARDVLDRERRHKKVEQLREEMARLEAVDKPYRPEDEL